METTKNLVVATDGSQSAINTFLYSCDLFKRTNTFERIIVVSIIDPTKEYLPAELQPAQLEQNIKNSLLCRFPLAKYEVVMRRKEVDAKTDVLKQAKIVDAGLLAIGFHGRKAESKKKEGGHTLLGSSVEHSINYSTIPFLIGKLKYEQKENFIFGVCLDGSYKALEALQFALKLSTPTDKVIALYSPHLITTHQTKERIKKSVQTYPTVTYVEIKANSDPGQQLINYIDDDPTYIFDFVLIGGSGERAELEKIKTMGRTARKILIEANANIILFP